MELKAETEKEKAMGWQENMQEQKIEVNLTQQEILELAYTIKKLAESEPEKTFEQVNCHQAVMEIMQELLKKIDSRYLDSYAGIRDFFFLSQVINDLNFLLCNVEQLDANTRRTIRQLSQAFLQDEI